jgi:hypothetical protein
MKKINMKSLKSINRWILKLTFPAVVLTVAAPALFAQIKIGEIEINGIKRPKITKRKNPPGNNESQNPQPETKTDGQTTNSTTRSTADEPPEWWLNVMLGDIGTAKEEVDTYTREGKMYLVSSASAPWLLRAVSEKARTEFAVDKKFNDWRKANAGNKFDTALDALAASAAKKLPGYIPNNNNFANRDVALEKMMKAQLKNLATLQQFKIGLFHASWVIEKNDAGLPANRYREAYIWAKDSADDHNYCHLYGFVVKQDYAGGGTYGATGIYLNTDALFGCPAN